MVPWLTVAIFTASLALCVLRRTRAVAQTVVLAAAAVNFIIVAALTAFTGGWAAVRLAPGEFLAQLPIQPILTFVGGCCLAALVLQTGGFHTVVRGLLRLRNTALGVSGTAVLLV